MTAALPIAVSMFREDGPAPAATAADAPPAAALGPAAPTLPAAPALAATDWAEAAYLDQALNDVVRKAATLAQGNDFGLEEGEVTLLGTLLAPAGTANWTRAFAANTNYALLAGGDADVQTLEIQVRDAAGNVVARSGALGRDPVVMFTPSAAGDYEVRIVLAAAARSSFCTLAFLREGVEAVPTERIRSASARYLGLAPLVRERFGDPHLRVVPGSWALFGAVLPPEGSVQTPPLAFGAGPHVIVAAGDDRVTDVDLFLFDAEGAELAKDEATDPTATLAHTTVTGTAYRVGVRNYASNGRGLVFATVFDLSPAE